MVSDTDQPSLRPGVVELLKRAKSSIRGGETMLRRAAEDLASARKLGASQRQIAEAVGKSAAWVNRLLKWRENDYRDETPFGPQAKASRKRGHRVQATKHSNKTTSTSEQAQATAERARAETAKAEAAKAEAEAQRAKADAWRARVEADKAKANARKARAEANARMRDFFRDAQKQTCLKGIDPDARTRLVKLLGMLGSQHEGERANAASQVERKRVEMGMTWEELIIPAATQSKARAA